MAGVGSQRRRLAGRVKFLADVNVSRHVVAELCGAGFDVVRVVDLLDPRSTDEAIMEEARRLGTAVISHDQDFTAILAISGATTPSLINIRVSYVDAGRLANDRVRRNPVRSRHGWLSSARRQRSALE